jgi:predicted lipoprotein with Yx(FWY)xxD motif
MYKTKRLLFVPALITGAALVAACGSAAATGHNAAATHPIAMKASSHTLRVLKSTVTGYGSDSIIVSSNGHAVYELSGDSSKHPKCDNTGCLSAWPAVTAKQPSEKGINGKLGVWHHHGIYQVTLNGHPLYNYAGDSSSGQANGNGQQSFGGTWWVLSSKGKWVTSKSSSDVSSGDTTTTTSGGGW